MTTPLIQTELHRHIDISMRTSTLYELAQERGIISQSTSFQAFRDQVILSRPLSSLDEVIRTFDLFQSVLDRPEVIERVCYEGVQDCYQEGTRWVELRFSPSFVAKKNGLSWEEVLSAFERGAARAVKELPDMRVGFICIATREYGSDAVSQTIEFYLKHASRFIGFDLAGSESAVPPKYFSADFKALRQASTKITIHAGEDSGPDNIWAAIQDLGASRIGHGISCIQDPELMKFLADQRICLEVCPTSNWLIGVVSSLKDHPLPQILRAGVPVSINTDDPGVFGSSMPGEMRICREIMGLSKSEVDLCLGAAQSASFLVSDDSKKN